MTTKITTSVRNAIREAVERSREYDPATLRITRHGSVTALKDADKTFAGNDTRRYLVGFVDEIVTPDGAIREGW